jgi:uncharacterized protein YacL
MSRLKTFAIIAIFGFIIGIIAKFAADRIGPWIEEHSTTFAGAAPWILAGIAGAVITLLIIIIWAQLIGKKDNHY